MYVLLAPEEGGFLLHRLDDRGEPTTRATTVRAEDLPAAVARLESENPRWIWDNTLQLYPGLLAAGVRVQRCHDLSLSRKILSDSPRVKTAQFSAAAREWQEASWVEPLLPGPDSPKAQESLFDAPQQHRSPASLLQEIRAQLSAIHSSDASARLHLLVAAESAAALVAAEMQFYGVPWDVATHRGILEAALGPEPAGYQRPARLEEIAIQLRELLGSPQLNPDSPQEVLKALHRAGIGVETTRKWELIQHQHPAIAPLLEYKQRSRLFTANGWAWLRSWVAEGRFRPEYVVGGVVSGRWASRGGGALQIPKNVRSAVRAEPGHVLVVADAAQLEPRILSAMAADQAMAAAGRGQDLYAGIAKDAFNGDRNKAKIAVLGAIYGATQGESGLLLPQLRRLYPKALQLVEDAARAGEKGERVSTWLGRGTPDPGESWRRIQQTSSQEEQRRADAWARSRGRFTRNFVVQGTAAEWAQCWLAQIRQGLREIPGAQLVFFLHDEVMLHVPAEAAEAAAAVVTQASTAAGRLLFGNAPVQFPLTVAVVDSYDQAK